jgi:hypothetical protein
MSLNLPDSMAESFIEAVGEGNLLRFLLNRNLSDELFSRFSFLDQGITVDAVIEALGMQLCIKLAKSGVLRIGEVLSRSHEALIRGSELTEWEVETVQKYLRSASIEIDDDASDWLTYRCLVPKSFRLFRTEARSLTELVRSNRQAAIMFPMAADKALVL